MSIASDLIRGHTDVIILAQLIKKDSYGYEINKVIQHKSKGMYELKKQHYIPHFVGWSRPDVSPPIGEMKIPALDDDIILLQIGGQKLSSGW